MNSGLLVSHLKELNPKQTTWMNITIALCEKARHKKINAVELYLCKEPRVAKLLGTGMVIRAWD